MASSSFPAPHSLTTTQPTPFPTTQPTPFPPLIPSLPLPLNQPLHPFPRFFPSPFPFPSSFGFFPFHPSCPPLSSSLNIPSPSNLPFKPLLWPRPTTTSSPTPFPNIVPSPFSTLKPSPQGRGGSFCPFRIDSKTFSFSFDGRRADSYAIHECRRNINSSGNLNFLELVREITC